jgi:conjugative relaxase-like TrwC/TraI family protein
MLRIIPNAAPASAKDYYTSAELADYYTQEQPGVWGGLGAQRLGLSGKVEKEQWEQLCENRRPDTGERLTPRNRSDRRGGYDFNFHAPKSLSLLYNLTRDPRLLDAFESAVRETMNEMEQRMQTRVRGGGRDLDRLTGNMVWGHFTHFTSRPVGGKPDPHLHSHCYSFNGTWDAVEKRWKAGQFADIKASAPVYESIFHSKLAHAMTRLGLEVRQTRCRWELAGLEKSTLDKFSQRTALIEKVARDKGITSAADKAGLGKLTREKKQNHLTLAQLIDDWRSRLGDGERASLDKLAGKIGTAPAPENPMAARQALQMAKDHLFERQAVVSREKLLSETLRRSYGSADCESVERVMARDDTLIHAQLNGKAVVSTKSVLEDEWAVVRYAREGRGAYEPLGSQSVNIPALSPAQQKAATQILGSRDRVTLISGKAGTGKSTLLAAIADQIEQGGKRVYAFAPSAGASRGVLREGGFPQADTIARLLVDSRLQEKIAGQVVLIDEASLMGIRTTRQVFDLIKKTDARLILCGDPSQHRSVEAGDTLSLLMQEAGLVPAELTAIRRQSGIYRQAVTALSQGRVCEAFRHLDAMGAIKEIKTDGRYRALAEDYAQSIQSGRTTLVVSPTHAEADKASQAIRQKMREAGSLGKEEREYGVLVNRNLTRAERADRSRLDAGDVLVFHQNAPNGIKKGQQLVVGQDELPLNQADRYTVYEPRTIKLSEGDKIRITRNSRAINGKQLHNGDLCTISHFAGSGDIVLTNEAVLSAENKHIDLGYAVTSYTAQGKTVSHVIVAESSRSLPAASKEQFYVSVSRGRHSVSIYTDDRSALLKAVSGDDQRASVLGLLSGRSTRDASLTLTSPPSRGRVREDVIYER